MSGSLDNLEASINFLTAGAHRLIPLLLLDQPGLSLRMGSLENQDLLSAEVPVAGL